MHNFENALYLQTIMKKITNNFIAILAATYFLFAGTGYNVVKFCHKSCKMMTEQVSSNSGCPKEKVEHSCCKIKQDAKKDLCCKKLHLIKELEDVFLTLTKKSNGCFFVRATVDTPLEVSTLNINNKEIKCIELIYNTLQDQIRNQNVIYSTIYTPPESELVITGREVLTLKSVLLI